MRNKFLLVALLMVFFTTVAFAQIGINAGLNMANEIRSFKKDDIAAGFRSENLTGYHIGLVYQFNPKKSGIGADLGLLISQKGCTFTDESSVADVIVTGYKEINYLEAPLNLRYRLMLGFLGVYGTCGLYAGYALDSRVVNETDNSIENTSFDNYMERVDYGYSFGAGVDLFKKIQLGASWSQGLKNGSSTVNYNPETLTNRVFSVNLVYLF